MQADYATQYISAQVFQYSLWLIDHLPLLNRSLSVKPEEFVAPNLEVPLHNLEDFDELREDEHAVAVGLHLRQHLVHHFELAAVAKQVIAQSVVLNNLKQSKNIM